MQHASLGTLETDEKSARGTVLLDGRSIPLNIELDGEPIDKALSFASVIAVGLEEYDRISKDVIVADLLDTYNSGWNECAEVQEDGTTKQVANPKLNSTEFRSRFLLSTVTVSGDSCVELWYEDDGLFWGHGIFVQSLEGRDFTNAEAQLFG